MTKNPKQPSRDWVLITGGSHGIGRALALECIRRQFAVVIVALPNADLRNVETELSQIKGAVFATFGVNLVKGGAVEEVIDWLEMGNIRPKYLINNAGFGRGGLFENTRWEEYRTMMQLNNQVMVDLTYAMLPILKKTKGGILNMSSVEATLPLPYKSVYTGTKAFVFNYSLALRQEFKHHNISVTALCPGPVITNEDGLKRVKAMGTLAKIAVTMPEDLASEAISGMIKGKDIIHPGVLVKFMAFLGIVIPRRVKLNVLEKMFSKYRTEEAEEVEEMETIKK
ncbi:SDR family NAD(P)-dependent oxidoreductase [Neolewinella aurantiaca]|uniref:SDR family NAD(P)-dependent oxidoreductase n=1 Tax=Neolewinella aurantiaca TaxID=2602767 RepID=A0A5C7G0X4_9BACT|nr:SDR family NAD(P)-dependent oxidoreductase [Neolewinella aurantiaca]TXF91399.1 SDR family NAD(P)-dependent oxidoreductase [Neolewinella aurantiaca]